MVLNFCHSKSRVAIHFYKRKPYITPCNCHLLHSSIAFRINKAFRICFKLMNIIVMIIFSERFIKAKNGLLLIA